MNLFEYDIPEKDRELFTTLLTKEGVTIKRIVSNTLTTPQTFKQKCDEWVCVLQGYAQLQMNDTIYTLADGDTLFIPANTEHTLLKTKKVVVWLAVYIEEREV